MDQDKHLTQDEFADCLLGTADPAVQAHAAACDTCRQEMESFGASMLAFNQASLAWGREHAAATDLAPGRRRVSASRAVFWPMGLAAAAALFFAVALPIAMTHARHDAAQIAASTAPAPAATDNAVGIADDNQMLASINAEISQPESSPLESFSSFRPHTAERVKSSAHENGRAGKRRSDAL